MSTYKVIFTKDSIYGKTYIDDSEVQNMTVEQWMEKPIYNNIKPCLLKDGEVQYYLNPNNFNLKEDGTSSVLDGTDGDVMIEFPKFGYSIKLSKDSGEILVSDEEREDLNYGAFSKETVGDKDKFYIGAYEGSDVNGELKSLPFTDPLVNKSLANDFRTMARKNGEGYNVQGWHQTIAILCLYFILTGKKNGQSPIGTGIISRKNETEKMTVYPTGNLYDSSDNLVGDTLTKGMNFGTSDGINHVKILGIEDFWGNIWDCVDGCSIGNEGDLSTTWNLNNWYATSELNTKEQKNIVAYEAASRRVVQECSEELERKDDGLLNLYGSNINWFDQAKHFAGYSLLFSSVWTTITDSDPLFIFSLSSFYTTDLHIGARLMYY